MIIIQKAGSARPDPIPGTDGLSAEKNACRLLFDSAAAQSAPQKRSVHRTVKCDILQAFLFE